MSYDTLGPGVLDYFPCRYGTSDLLFRGPRRDLTSPYVAFIGGTLTFGKFIEQPFPLKVEHLTGLPSVNFGQVNAGIDVFSKDAVVSDAARKARVAVVEVLGAANLTNRLFTVHARRNDRLMRCTAELLRLYPEIDFTQFNFTRHLLSHLYLADEDRFSVVRRNLQRTWVRKMRSYLKKLDTKTVLLKVAAPDHDSDQNRLIGVKGEPVLVTDAMVDSLHDVVSAIVHVPMEIRGGGFSVSGMGFGELEIEAARAVAPPQVHNAAARALLPVLDRLM